MPQCRLESSVGARKQREFPCRISIYPSAHDDWRNISITLIEGFLALWPDFSRYRKYGKILSDAVKHFAHKLTVLLLVGVFLFARDAPSSTETKSGGRGVISLQVKPCCPHVLKGDRVQFAVWLLGKTLAADWSVSGPGCKAAACGTVSSDGLYTAPAIIPKPLAV
jgi:hypothetical protein